MRYTIGANARNCRVALSLRGTACRTFPDPVSPTGDLKLSPVLQTRRPGSWKAKTKHTRLGSGPPPPSWPELPVVVPSGHCDVVSFGPGDGCGGPRKDREWTPLHHTLTHDLLASPGKLSARGPAFLNEPSSPGMERVLATPSPRGRCRLDPKLTPQKSLANKPQSLDNVSSGTPKTTQHLGLYTQCAYHTSLP